MGTKLGLSFECITNYKDEVLMREAFGTYAVHESGDWKQLYDKLDSLYASPNIVGRLN
jgi:hypothetical protein